jgi:iron complex transport system ATP-binding protein
LGPNGAGKTTLLRTMARLIPAMAGSISIAGRDFGSIAQAELARLQAVVLTDRLNPGLLTSYEVVALGRHPHTGFFGKLGPEMTTGPLSGQSRWWEPVTWRAVISRGSRTAKNRK